MSSKFNQVLFNLFRLDQDKASNKAIHQTISSATEIKGTNMLILMMAIFIASIGPVSYTHLDVYKRQLLESS